MLGGVEALASRALVPAAAVAVGPGGPSAEAPSGEDVGSACSVGVGTEATNLVRTLVKGESKQRRTRRETRPS